MLLITSNATAEVIVNTVVGAVHVTQDTDPESLRGCDTCSSTAKFTVFVVTDRLVVRGTDFRAPMTGITEIIDIGLESDREALQALSRVGRYGERFEHLITSCTSLVDETLKKILIKILINYQVQQP